MKHFSLKYKLLVLTIITLFVSALAADIPFIFKAGDVISAEQMNQNFATLNTAKQERVTGKCPAGSAIRDIAEDGTVTCEVDDIGNGTSAGVDAVNGMTGAVILQAGDNITIDDSTPGQIVISSTSAGGTYSADNTSLQLSGSTFSIKDDGVSTAKLADASITPEKIKLPFYLLGESPNQIFVATNDNLAATSAAITGTVGAVGELYADRATGVWGHAQGYGVYGSSPSGIGVFGVSNTGIGLLGRSSTRGIVGTQGSLTLPCAGTYAVGGCAETTGVGVQGISSGGSGVYGKSTSFRGVEGISEISTGVYGFSPSYMGVEGISQGGRGVYGKSTSFRGVEGVSETSTGVYGFSPSYRGVEGISETGIGVIGISTTRAVIGTLGEIPCAGTYAVGGCATTANSAQFKGGSGGSGTCSYAGGAGWSCTSDKNAKENFQAVNSVNILEALVAMPITKWNMKGDVNQTPHLGPVAQDFHKAFGLGEDDVTINTADAQGVSLAAIQGLYQLIQQQQAQIEALEAKLANQ